MLLARLISYNGGMSNDIGIYKIFCRPNGKVYIGSSVRLAKRIRNHKSDLRQGKHPNQRLQRAWNKYGKDNFVFEVLLNCDKDSVFVLEQKLIDEYQSSAKGFNIAACAESARLGAVLSDAQKAKASKTLTGRTLTAEHRANISNGGRGVKKSEATKQKMRESAALRPASRAAKVGLALKGKPKSEQHKQKLMESTLKRCQDPKYLEMMRRVQIESMTPERGAAISARNIEAMKDPELRARISKALTGRKASAETKEKLSAAHKGRKLSEEQKALLSKIATERWAAKKAAQI